METKDEDERITKAEMTKEEDSDDDANIPVCTMPDVISPELEPQIPYAGPKKVSFARRLLVIDAMNVMHMDAGDRITIKDCKDEKDQKKMGQCRKPLDCLSLLPIVRYFVRRKYPVEIVVKECFVRDIRVENRHIWKELENLKILIVTPNMLHDDIVALTVANDACGSIITRDRFRDHLLEFPQLIKVRDRNIMLQFVKGNKGKIFWTDAEGDKYYKNMFIIQNYKSGQFHVPCDDPEYKIVKDEKWPNDRRKGIIECIDKIYDLAEARFLLDRGMELPETNRYSQINFTTEIRYHIDQNDGKKEDGERHTVAERKKTLYELWCWRNKVAKQELQYQLRKQSDDTSQQCVGTGFAKEKLCCFDNSDKISRKSSEYEDLVAYKFPWVKMAKNFANRFLVRAFSLPSLQSSFAQETEDRMFHGDSRAEQKKRLWKTLIDEMNIDEKSLYNFLSSFQGFLEKEFVLNKYYDELYGLPSSIKSGFDRRIEVLNELLAKNPSFVPKRLLHAVISSDRLDQKTVIKTYRKIKRCKLQSDEPLKKKKEEKLDSPFQCESMKSIQHDQPDEAKKKSKKRKKRSRRSASTDAVLGRKSDGSLLGGPTMEDKIRVWNELKSEKHDVNAAVLFQAIDELNTVNKRLIMLNYHITMEQMENADDVEMPSKTANNSAILSEPGTSTLPSHIYQDVESEAASQFQPAEGAFMTLEEARKLHARNGGTSGSDHAETNWTSGSFYTEPDRNGNPFYGMESNGFQQASDQSTYRRSSLFPNDFYGVEKEQILRMLVSELNLENSLLYDILSSWKGSPQKDQVVNAYLERLEERDMLFPKYYKLPEKERFMREILKESQSINKNILSQVLAVSDTYDKQIVMSEYHKRIEQIDKMNSDFKNAEHFRRQQSEKENKERMLHELLYLNPSLDENVLSQVIAVSDSNDKQDIIAEYRKRKAQTEEFNRRLTQRQIEYEDKERMVAKLCEMGFNEGLVRTVMASVQGKIDISAVVDKCLLLL